MHILFQNDQYLGSYYFTRSADDPVQIEYSNSELLAMLVKYGPGSVASEWEAIEC